MGAARRLYVYAVSAISLLVLSIGVYNLAALVLGELEIALGGSVIGGASTGREQVSLAIALVAVGTPVYAIHWWLVSRGWNRAGDAAVEERNSAIRALHLGLVATVALAVATFSALRLLEGGFVVLVGARDAASGLRPGDELARLIVAGVVWWYHWPLRNRDLRHDQLAGAAAWLSRLHRYGWAFAGLMLLVLGSSQVIETVSSVLIGRSGFGADDRLWLGSLSWSLAMIIVGAGVLWLHLDDARRLVRDREVVGQDDRTSAIRATYVGVVILVTLSELGLSAASSVAESARWVLGVSDGRGVADFLELVVGPLLFAIPFALAGWLHWSARRQETASASPGALAEAERLLLHVATAVGIVFLTVGAAQLLGRLVEVATGASTEGTFFRFEVAWFVAQIIVGVAIWIPAWSAVLRRRALTPERERDAMTGRAYLYLAVGASLVAAVPSAAFTLYRLIDTVLGGGGVALGLDLSIPVSVVAVASVVAIYHVRLLMSDLRLVAPGTEIADTDPALATVGAGAEATLPLTLRGPIGTDLGSVATKLRARLPAGVVLEDR